MVKLFLIAILIVFLGCEKPLNETLPYEGDKLVLYGEISTDEIFSIKLSKTFDPNKTIDFTKYVENAIIEIYENGKLFDVLNHESKGVYVSKSKKKPIIGNNYFVKVSCVGFPNIETETVKAISPVKISKIIFEKEIESNLNKSIPTKELIAEIIDEPNEENFYAIEIYGVLKDENRPLTRYLIGKNPDFEDNCGYLVTSNYYFKDACFQNNLFTVAYGVELSTYDKEILKNVRPNKLVVKIRKIDKNLYEYAKTTIVKNKFEKAFNPPTLTFSNINGGFGLFTAVGTKTVEFMNP